MQSFLEYDLPSFISSEDLDDLVTRIDLIPDFFGISLENPIQVKDPSIYPFNEKLLLFFSTKYTTDFVRAKKVLSFVLTLPDELIKFEDIDFSNFTFLDNLAHLMNIRKYKIALQIFDYIFPFFMRCDFEALIKINSVKIIINSITSTRKDLQPFFDAFQVRALTLELKNQLKQKGYFSTILIQQNKAIRAISKTDKAHLIIPYVANEITPVLYDIIQLCFHPSYKQEAEKISLCTYLQESLLLICSLYPPALTKIPYQKIVNFFITLQKSNIMNILFPSFDFVLENVESSSLAFFGENIAALMASASYLQQITSYKDEEMYLKLLHTICTKSRVGQMSLTRCFVLFSQYPIFKKSYEKILELIENNNPLMGQLLSDIFENNYSTELYQLYKQYKLKTLFKHDLYLDQITLSKPFYLIHLMGHPETDIPENDMIIYTRLVDSLLIMDNFELYDFLNENPGFYDQIKNIILQIIEKGKNIVDIRLCIPFAHICSSLMEFCSKLVYQSSLKQHMNLYPVEFILQMFNAIIKSFPPLQPTFEFPVNSFAADFLTEMKRFVKSMAHYDHSFFVLAFSLVTEKYQSYAYSTLILLRYSFEYNEQINLSEFPSGSEPGSLAYYYYSFLISEDQAIHYSIYECIVFLTQRFSKFSTDILDILIQKLLKLSSREGRKSLRGSLVDHSFITPKLLSTLSHMTAIPSIKSSINQKPERSITLLKLAVQFMPDNSSYENEEPLFAVDIITNLLCRTLSTSDGTTDYFQPTEDVAKQILLRIISVLSNDKKLPDDEVYSYKLMRLFSYLTESDFYIQVLLQKIERKLTIIIENILKSLGENYNKFIEEAINAMINIGRFDPNYAKTIIQCDDLATDLSAFERTKELISILQSKKQKVFNDSKGKVDPRLRKANLDHVYPPSLSTPRVIDSIGDFTFYETLVSPAKYLGE